MSWKYYFDPSIDYGDGNISSSGTIPFKEAVWQWGLKQHKIPLMGWVQ